MDSTLKRRGTDRFHVVSTWNPRGVFAGLLCNKKMRLIVTFRGGIIHLIIEIVPELKNLFLSYLFAFLSTGLKHIFSKGFSIVCQLDKQFKRSVFSERSNVLTYALLVGFNIIAKIEENFPFILLASGMGGLLHLTF